METIIPGVLVVHRGAFQPGDGDGLRSVLNHFRSLARPKDGRTIARLGVPYKYMGRPLPHHPIPAGLVPVFDRVSQLCGSPFNAAVVNWYQDGGVALPHHSDTACIRELGVHPTIAGLSFGSARVLELVPRSTKSGLVGGSVLLNPGDLYVMSGISQQKYLHGMPALPGAGERMSITFRHHTVV